MVTALGLLGPGLAYLLGRPGLLGKRSDGTIAAWARALHASYFALCRFGWLVGRGSGPDEVLPRLVVGPRATPLQSLELRKDRSVATLDLTCELPELGTLRLCTLYSYLQYMWYYEWQSPCADLKDSGDLGKPGKP